MFSTVQFLGLTWWVDSLGAVAMWVVLVVGFFLAAWISERR